MFASMPNFTDEHYDKYGDDYGLHCLGVLNQIISEFDAVNLKFQNSWKPNQSLLLIKYL